MPASVRMGGGPVSGNVLSKWPARGPSSSTGLPFEFSIGVQRMRSVDVARWMKPSPQYIQYRPSNLAAISRPPESRVTIPADLYLSCAYLPPFAVRNAGPCFVQWMRSRDVAMPTEYVSRF